MAFNYKIILIGDGGVGKSAFVNRHRTGEFDARYIPTMGVNVVPLTFNTNYGKITFKVWDCAGQEKFGGLREGYYQQAQGAICMFDLTSRITCKNIAHWILSVCGVVPNIPFVICGNKCDMPDIKVTELDLPTLQSYYPISARSNYNFEKPFLDLAKQLTGHKDLEFVEMPPIEPPVVNIINPLMGGDWPKNKVSWMAVPGGMMRITCDFFSTGEIVPQ